MQETGAPGGAPSFPVATNYGAGAGKVPWCFPDWPVPEGVPGKPGTLISSKMAAGAEPLVFQSEWEKRTDLSPRAFGKVKLGPEIKNLESFGKRAYTNELTSQRTVITDLLGGECS